MENVEPSEVLETLKGSIIEGGQETEDGLHIYLQDGRILLFVGEFTVFVGILDKGSIQ